MSNTTFSGPVRSEGGFDLIRKNDQGEVTSDLALKYFEESITVAAAATEGGEKLTDGPDKVEGDKSKEEAKSPPEKK